jgi:hypothetical protein
VTKYCNYRQFLGTVEFRIIHQIIVNLLFPVRNDKIKKSFIVKRNKLVVLVVEQLEASLYLKHRVKYGVRFPKFIWAPCAELYSLAETPQRSHTPPPPPIWAHIPGRYWPAKRDDISL